MASILDRYGIKEVADVTFYDIDSNGAPKNPVLYLDTLKVSTVEQSAEETTAKGGKGNGDLIAWDYGKEITVTLEDALFSAKSLSIMFGNGAVTDYSGANAYIMKTEMFVATQALTVNSTITTQNYNTTLSGIGCPVSYHAPDGKLYPAHNIKLFSADGTPVIEKSDSSATVKKAVAAGEKLFVTYDIKVAGSVIEVSANSFPGTYYVTGDTFARSEATGKDEFFQFVIPKGKVQSSNTITLEAEGEPSVFNLSLKVLRPESGNMMQLIKYDLADTGSNAQAEDLKVYHNHDLAGHNNEALS